MKKTNLIGLILFLISICIFQVPAFAQAPNWLWAKKQSAGGVGSMAAYASTIDKSGNIYVAGHFDCSTVIFGSDTLSSSGQHDIYLVKYNSEGSVLWARSEGGSGFEMATSICTDDSGHVYVTGYFNSPFIISGIDTLTIQGYRDILLLKYNSNGDIIWARSAGGSRDDEGTSVNANNSGIYLSGYFKSPTIQSGSFTLTNASSTFTSDIFLFKYDVNGTLLWSRRAGGTQDDFGRGLTSDSLYIYQTGIFKSSTIKFDSITLIDSGGVDLFTVKYDTAGKVVWANRAGGTMDDYATTIALDDSGYIYVTGEFASPFITYGVYTLTNTIRNYFDMFLVKYEPDGKTQWAISQGNGVGEGMSVCTSKSGVCVTGWYDRDTVIIGVDSLVNYGSRDLFITKYSRGGSLLWATTGFGNGWDFSNSVVYDNHGYLYIAGGFKGSTANFGSIILTNSNSDAKYNMFLAKMDTVYRPPNGIAPVGEVFNLIIYPNPFTSETTLAFNREINNATINIMDLTGKELQTINFTGRELKIGKANMKEGIYFIRIIDGNMNVINRKIIIY